MLAFQRWTREPCSKLLDLCSSGNAYVVLKALLTFTDPKPGAQVHFSSLLLVKLLGKEGALGIWGWLGLISGTQGGR